MLAGHGQGEAGQELEATVLFADLQDSTALAERLSPTRFSELLRGFYAVATEVITARGGTIDKFLGDGMVALFLPGPSGLDHARRALAAAHALIAALDPDGDGHPWPPVRIGVHSGRVWLGPVPGPHGRGDVTALGDTVNVTAHLCGAAPAGHVAASAEALRAAGRPDVDDASPAMQLKGRRERVRARVYRPHREAAQWCFAAAFGASNSLRYSPYPSASSLSTGMKRSAAELMQ